MLCEFPGTSHMISGSRQLGSPPGTLMLLRHPNASAKRGLDQDNLHGSSEKSASEKIVRTGRRPLLGDPLLPTSRLALRRCFCRK